MSALWPTTLPGAMQADDLQVTSPDMVLRSDVDTGPAMLRRRFTAAPEQISGSIIVTRAQLAVFRTFFITSIGGGAIPFEWFHPETRVIMDFRFTQRPSWKPYGPRLADQSDCWRISLALETVPGSEQANPTDPPGPGAGLFLPPHQFNDATGGLPTGLDAVTLEDIPVSTTSQVFGGGVTVITVGTSGPPTSTSPVEGDHGGVGEPGGTVFTVPFGSGSYSDIIGGGGA